MANKQLTFHSVNIYVENLEASIFFYQRLGFQVDFIDDDHTIVKLSEKGNFQICLKGPHRDGFEPGTVTFQFGPVLKTGEHYGNLFSDLAFRGFSFENFEAHKTNYVNFHGVGLMKDPSGCYLEMYDERSDESRDYQELHDNADKE